MGEINALEKLRTAARNMAKGSNLENHEECNLLLIIADEIEAEIAEARETMRKKHRAERVYWQNELHKILDTINGQKRFWGDCMDYPLPEATIPPSEIARCMLAERYMLLPVDADGVPIHVGDVMCSSGIREKGHKVIVSALFEDGFVEYGSVNGFIGPLNQEDWVHVKPRTLEDILNDYLQEREKIVRKLESSLITLGEAESEEKACDKPFADEIRELLGGDAESKRKEGDESRYSELFGTPKRAARTLAGKCCDCCECVLADACEYGCDEGCLLSDESNFDALLEWLESEVRDD